MIDVYLECPNPTASGPVASECGQTKSVSWSTPGQVTSYFYWEGVNKNLISFDFTGITNNGSSVEVDIVYPRNGVTITAQTLNLGVISSNTKKYHFLDFGITQQTNGLIFLKVRTTGGSTGSFSITLDCSVLVGSRLMCYQILKSAPRNLCVSCPTSVRVYYEKTSTLSSALFSYSTWYSDPELQTVANTGYYTPVDQPVPKTIYSFDGSALSINRYCDPTEMGCNNTLTQTNLLSGYTNNSPYLTGTPNPPPLDGLKYSIKDTFVTLPNTDNGYVEMNISNTQSYQQKVVASISDANSAANVISMSWTDKNPATAEFFTLIVPTTLITIPKNSTKKIYVAINGSGNPPTKTLRVRVAVGLKKSYNNAGSTPVTTTVSASCLNTIYSATTGIHAYSPYDAANSPKCTTKLYSLQNSASWGLNSRVWHDGLLTSPAYPHYYALGTNVFKVGQVYKRWFGLKFIYKIKTSALRKIGRALGLSKKDPVSANIEALGPKDWQTSTQVPACIEPTFNDIGLIKQVLSTPSLKVPTTYMYLVGKNASSKILANDSVFTEFDYKTQTQKPITGAMHAQLKYVSGYVKASKDGDIRAAIGSAATGFAGIGLGAMAAAIILKPASFGLVSSVCVWGPAVGGLALTPAGWIIAGVLIAAAMVLLLLSIFGTNTSTIEENCKMFDKVYTNNEYLENGNTIYTNSGMTVNGITGFYTDGGYFYTTTNGTVSSKEVSYTNINGARVYSFTPDNPTFLQSIQSFWFLPYVSGIPVAWTTQVYYSHAVSSSVTPTTNVGALNTSKVIDYVVPEGFFEADSQVEADALVDSYISGLTADTQGIYVSSEQLPTATGITTTFTHEIKVETLPAVWPVCYNNNDGLGVSVGKVLYYDTNGIYSVLDGYYSLSGVSGNYRTFYKTSAGTVIDYFDMASSSSSTVVSPTSGSLPVVTTGQTFTSSWYFYSTDLENVQYNDANNLHGFNDDWNTSAFYSSEYVKRGMIDTPITKSNLYTYISNTGSYAFENASEGWYQEVPNTFNEDPFLIQSAFTIYLDSIQYCSDDVDNGVFVTCVDSTGINVPSFYGVKGQLSVTTSSGVTSHEFTIESNEYRVLVPLGTEYIGAITNSQVTTIYSTNPISGITYVNGTSVACVTATPTPTPEFSPDVSPTPTPTPPVTPTVTPTPCSIIVRVDNNATGTIGCDNVQVNGVSVTYSSGDNFTVEAGELGFFTTNQIGTYTIDVSYTSHTGEKAINLVDCDGNSFCEDDLNTAGGTAIFENVVLNCPCGGGIQILFNNGDCI